MAYPIYRYEIKYWSRFDPTLSAIIQGAFADESNHVHFGEEVNADYFKKLSLVERNRVKRMTHDFSNLMREIFNDIIKRYIGLYQECANQYMDLVGDIEIFPGKKMHEVTEEEQTRLVLNEIEQGHQTRLQRIGIV
ncbi:MAG: hypothetical protein HC848_00185 [Limnobacter sp.]|nr:hypothetical protein [Limnobacter sp.]